MAAPYFSFISFHDKNEAHAYEMDKYPHKTRDSGRDSRDNRDSRDSRESRDSRDRKDRDRNVKESPRGIHQDSPRNNSDKSYSSRRSRGSSGSKHGNNQAMYKPNSHSTSDPEKRLKEMLSRANDWTMHTSSSGKKYYYNCKTEVSQWEKPKEWIEKEALEKAIGGKLPASSSHSNVKTTPSKGNDKHSSKSRSQSQQQQQPYRTQDRTSSTPNQSESWRQSSQAGYSQRRYSNSQSQSKLNQSSQSENSRSHSSQGSVRQSDHYKNNFNEDENRKESGSRLNDNDTHQNAHQQHSPSLNRRLSEGNGTDQGQRDSPNYQRGRPLSTSLATDMYGRLKNLVTPINSVGKREKNESPKVNSSPSSNVSTVSPLPTTSPKIVRTPLQNQQQRWRKSSSRSPVSHHHQVTVDVKEELPQKFSNPSPMSIASVSDLSSPARSYPSPDNSTPLSHSSNHPDKSRVEKMEEMEARDVEPPDKPEENSRLSETDVVNCSETKELSENSVDPLHTSLQVEPIHEPKPKEDEFQFKEIVFSAESHLNYFNEDLIKHKINLPVEQLEKQAHQVQRDSYRLGVENYSQVMMDLKFARSLVRTTEIQANVQASRIVFLRQQVKELEKLKNENAYMT